MKIGIDAPWYDDPVERMAFNLYAMSLQRITDLEDVISDVIDGNVGLDEIADEYDLTDDEYRYVINELRDRGEID